MTDAVLALVIFGVTRAPKCVLAALFCQFLLLPALAFVLGRALGAGPSIALGMMLVASSPGAASQIFSQGWPEATRLCR